MNKPDFKTAFLNSVKKHLEIFNCGDYNLIKVVQDALVRKVGSSHRGLIQNKISLPSPLLKFLFLLKKIKNKSDSYGFKIKNTETIIISPARIQKGKHVYLENILRQLSPEEPVIINSHNHQAFSERGIDLKRIIQNFENDVPDKESIKLARELKASFNEIVKRSIFKEEDLIHILVAYNEFWLNASSWNKFLSDYRFKRLYLLPGYQTECIIYACRLNDIEVIELQHGIISRSSDFYIYPEIIRGVAAKALFPDKIFVFGQYWKDILCTGFEFKEHQIEIIGDYFYNPPKEETISFPVDKKIIVFAGQKPVSSSFQLDYLKYLKDDIRKRSLDFIVIHKPHPLEDVKMYNSFYDEILQTSEFSVTELIPYADIFISMFSTTLYEARDREVKTFALYYEPFGHLIQDVIDNKIALKLLPEQNPVDVNIKLENPPKGYYFSNQDLEKIT
jgi:hypothetical protein